MSGYIHQGASQRPFDDEDYDGVSLGLGYGGAWSQQACPSHSHPMQPTWQESQEPFPEETWTGQAKYGFSTHLDDCIASGSNDHCEDKHDKMDKSSGYNIK